MTVSRIYHALLNGPHVLQQVLRVWRSKTWSAAGWVCRALWEASGNIAEGVVGAGGVCDGVRWDILDW